MRRTSINVLLVFVLAAGLVPVSQASEKPARPTRTIAIPETMARTRALAARRGTARFSFPATHIAFSWSGDEGTGVRFRTIGPNGSGRWQDAPESDDMHARDRHFSAVISVDRPIAIDYRPVAPGDKKVDEIELDYLNTIDGPTVERTVPLAARTTNAQQPDIITRAEWGADESLKSTSGGCDRDFYPVQQLFVHHTAGKNYDNNPEATMRAVYWYHTVRQGWCDIGYNFVISWDGRIYEGRWARRYKPWEAHTSEDIYGRAVAGAHVSGYNSGSVGVSLMGNFETARPPKAMRAALVELLAWEADRHDLAPRGRHTYRNPDTGTTRRLKYISGHRDAGYTSCPGGNMYGRLPGIRRRVAETVGDGKPTSEIQMSAAARRVVYGTEATLTGTLKDENGVFLPGRTISIYQRAGHNPWFEAASVVTSGDGSFTYSFTPERTIKSRAVFFDTPTAWGSQTPNTKVKVRHAVTLEAVGGSPDPAGTVIYPSGTETVPLRGTGAPVHTDRVIKIWIGRVEPDGSLTELADVKVPLQPDGTYSYDFSVPEQTTTTTYRARARYPGDKGHVWGRSAPLDLIVP